MKEYGFIKVAAAIPEVRVADCMYNTGRIKELVFRAAEAGASMVCFPELSVTGYTCGDLFFQDTLLKEAENATRKLLEETRNTDIIFMIGTPLKYRDKLYNTALVCKNGSLLGIVPKTWLPNSAEFYEKRWFETIPSDDPALVDYAGSTAPLGCNLLFGKDNFCFAVEICEDLWSPVPPSSYHTLAGAKIIFNLSSSNELIGKNQYRRSLICQQSARSICGYVYVSSGWGESTTDLVFSGNASIVENGIMLAESRRFLLEEQLIFSEIDVDCLTRERMVNPSFQTDDEGYEKIECSISGNEGETSLSRTVNPLPFIPSEKDYDESCREVFSIQIGGLAKRLIHTQIKNILIGVSGGLDSTLALLVCVKTFDKLGLPRKNILGITMPGFGTTGRTYNNALKLMQDLGISIREISIKDACNQHFSDIGHDPSVHDVTYENTQARERTQILMDVANQVNGLVIGTGDMSELALGWATYNGDHMSMYGVNSGIPKTLVRHLVKWVAETQVDESARFTLLDIVETPVSPELIPSKNNEQISQQTEAIVGPYELHDFYLYYMLRYGFSPGKIFFLAQHAFRGTYEKKEILKWMEVFFRRFFSQQFKRSCMPDGPKVGSVNLSPRGDWRMPSDACATVWLQEVRELMKNE